MGRTRGLTEANGRVAILWTRINCRCLETFPASEMPGLEFVTEETLWGYRLAKQHGCCNQILMLFFDHAHTKRLVETIVLWKWHAGLFVACPHVFERNSQCANKPYGSLNHRVHSAPHHNRATAMFFRLKPLYTNVLFYHEKFKYFHCY